MGRKKSIYVVETFYRATDDWTHSEHFNDFNLACEHAYELLLEKTCDNPDVSYDDFYEAMENGQNWCVNNEVIGISDITPDEPEYEEFVLLLQRGSICDNPSFLSGLSYPFKSMDELQSIMDRFVIPSGYTYLVLSREEFSDKINNGVLIMGQEFDYLLYVKIGV